mmetsp:Transcript_38564/g.91416  ORF Transcript_38564/g.91416 Transcript_38564/m.91416 type:complete len:391 (-) Transcript_38564:854-2026(-)
MSRIALRKAVKFCGVWLATRSPQRSGSTLVAVRSGPHCFERALATARQFMTVPGLLSTVVTFVMVSRTFPASSLSRRLTILPITTRLPTRTPDVVVRRHIWCSRGTNSVFSRRNSMLSTSRLACFSPSSWIVALPESNAFPTRGTRHWSAALCGMCETSVLAPRSSCMSVSPVAAAMIGSSAGIVVDMKSSLLCLATMARTSGTTTPDSASVRSSARRGGSTLFVRTRWSNRCQNEFRSLMNPAFSMLPRCIIVSRNLSARRRTSSVKYGDWLTARAPGRADGCIATIAFSVGWSRDGSAEKSSAPRVLTLYQYASGSSLTMSSSCPAMKRYMSAARLKTSEAGLGRSASPVMAFGCPSVSRSSGAVYPRTGLRTFCHHSSPPSAWSNCH